MRWYNPMVSWVIGALVIVVSLIVLHNHGII